MHAHIPERERERVSATVVSQAFQIVARGPPGYRVVQAANCKIMKYTVLMCVIVLIHVCVARPLTILLKNAIVGYIL